MQSVASLNFYRLAELIDKQKIQVVFDGKKRKKKSTTFYYIFKAQKILILLLDRHKTEKTNHNSMFYQSNEKNLLLQ